MEHSPDRVARLEAEVSRLTSLVEGMRAERPDARQPALGKATRSSRSRRDLLKLAGAAAAGAAGVALAGGRGVTNAYATTTDTNFVANGTATFGFDSQPGHFTIGVYGLGTAYGVEGVGTQLGGNFFPGSRGNIYLRPIGTVGPPTGNHWTGDVTADANGVVWICIQGDGSTVGTLAPLQLGGINNAIHTAVSNKQYILGGNNGTAWVDVDAANLSLTITPHFNARAIFYANADLWTDTTGINQDLAVTVNGTVHSWKESGGYAGTFSPNAAFIHGVFGDFFKGTTYTVKLQWKANKATATAQHIYIGAGPIPAGSTTYSPTTLSVQLITI